MKQTTKFVLEVLIILSLTACHKKDKMVNSYMDLTTNWLLKMDGGEEDIVAEVPGTVHTDLLRQDIITSPYYRDNEKELQWIDKENWIYSCRFNINGNQLESQKIFLLFKGIDTYADVFLNDSMILQTNNMFRSWKVDIKHILTKGENTLRVKIYSPIKIGLDKLDEYGIALPAVNDQSQIGGIGEKRVSVFTRKAPYHYGWDWGPRFVTMGIWRPVELQFIDAAEITNIFLRQRKVNKEVAEINAEISATAFKDGDYKIEILEYGSDKVIAAKNIKLEEDNTENIELNFKIEDPKLWWPNGYGEPYIYSFKTCLYKDDKLLDKEITKTGIRTIEVIREKDSVGTSFYFSVNGVPVFAKGANYIPNDCFVTRVGEDKYKTIISSAAEANMNMLRVWGGGIYENDIFYELCDELGILVWQDFMFACSMYPGNPEFLDNVKEEAIENVVRLRNHPCIALWCGNNENDAAWCRESENCGWGWKQRYDEEQRRIVWDAYDTLFHKILPDIVQKYDADKFYWPSSPLESEGKSSGYESKSGDVHYWGVWHGGEPFERFGEVIPRFMSEYGFQSFPEMNTIRRFTEPEDHGIYSDVMLAHQRSPIGNQKIKEYMEKYFQVPDKFEDLIYMSQLLQAYGIESGIKYHRLNKPYCMGSLYWQLNDTWPGPSWAGIDYYGNWKALHYAARDAFGKTTVTTLQQDDQIGCYILNDDKNLSDAELIITVLDFEGYVYHNEKSVVHFDFEKSTKVFDANIIQLLGKLPLNKALLKVELKVGRETIFTGLHYFVYPCELDLKKCNIRYELEEKSDVQYLIVLSADKLAKNVMISIPNVQITLSDNYFDLLPGERKEVILSVKQQGYKIKEEDIRLKVMNDV
ncbi:MAG: glycoside hydrolase family 2 protein [Bacteroidales bacterium]|nr:glycoside hydrolase family 2 protein [Bacteroidales bacterium]